MNNQKIRRMKKNIKYSFMVIALAFAITALAGCKKENTPKNAVYDALSSDLQTLYDQMPSRDYSFISVVGDGILSFENVQQYQQTCEQLQNDCDLWDSLFHENYSNLKESELMDLQDKLGYDEFSPIVMFEEDLNVSGNMLFDTQREAMQLWVDNEFEGENPTDDIFIMEGEQAVHNIYREVCINDTIYQFRTDATVVVPLSMFNIWRNIRNYPTDDLLNTNGILLKGYVADESSSKSTKVPFTCKASGELNSSNTSSLFSGQDYSYWIVTGTTGTDDTHLMNSKLVNYKYHKLNKRGKKVFKKCWRNCSIITTHQVFYKEHYRGFFSSNLVNTDTEEFPQTLPTPKNKKTAYGKVLGNIPPTGVTHVTSRFKLGVYQNPTLKIKIDGQEITKQLNMVH
jgi:hypothetical protein